MKQVYHSLLLILLCSTWAVAQTKGPEKGHLIIAGGALQDTSVFSKFIALAGGKDGHIVVIPTAGGYEVNAERRDRIITQWQSRGAGKVSVLHTNAKEEADKNSFASVIDDAQGVWFTGGRQWRLVDAYAETLVEQKLFELLDRGGVIGGSSAGATIQGSYLARGDTRSNTVMMGDHEVGMGFIKNIAIDQHTLARNRHFDMFEIIEKRPELLGIAIDENTAIHVTGDSFEVLGQSYVLIYDGTHWDQQKGRFVPNERNQERFHLLRKGGFYDLLTRKVISR